MVYVSGRMMFCLRAYSSKKVILTHVFPSDPLGKPEDITFAANTFLAYFLLEDLELPQSVKPPAMVLTL